LKCSSLFIDWRIFVCGWEIPLCGWETNWEIPLCGWEIGWEIKPFFRNLPADAVSVYR